MTSNALLNLQNGQENTRSLGSKPETYVSNNVVMLSIIETAINNITDGYSAWIEPFEQSGLATSNDNGNVKNRNANRLGRNDGKTR